MSLMLDTFVRELRHGALAAGLFVAMIAPGSLDARGAGTITGSATTTAGALAPLRVTSDQKVCGTEAPDEAIVRVSCNTHPWMYAWLVVTDDIAVVTGADGRFAMRDVPAGTYELRVWHEALKGAPRKVTVAAGQTVAANFEMK